MTTLFTRIIQGELPGHFVWRDEHAVAFLSINPIQTGHALVVPVLEVDHWLDLPAEIVAHLTEVSRVIGQAQMQALNPDRVGLIIAGFEVPHVHVHVIPTFSMADLSFANAAATVDHEALAATASSLRAALEASGASHVSAA
ncbi:MAG: HIT family protein [Acidimicrobiales bacterium]|nr:HIT family protein [Acidimicrobiales bacterium]